MEDAETVYQKYLKYYNGCLKLKKEKAEYKQLCRDQTVHFERLKSTYEILS